MVGQVQKLLKERGIEHHTTMPGSPQSNGKAERFNRTIEDKAEAMLETAGLSKGFWELAWNAALHIYNHFLTRTLKWRTPYEIWYSGKVPNVSHLHVFGCKGYMHVPADKRCKLDVKAIEVMLVGYEPDSKGYKVWDRHTCSLKQSRDVLFDESSFPSQQAVETQPSTSQPSLPVPVMPNLVTEPPISIPRPPSPATSTSSAEEVQSLLDPPE
jgi:hypothetical protein